MKADATDRPSPAAVTVPAPAEAVTALYQAHALGLIRLAVVMLGDRAAAEDAVQEAFCGLYRRWHHLADPGKALSYVRSSVINSCRTMLRRRRRQAGLDPSAGDPPGESAEAMALIGEEHRQVLTAIRQLPARQRAKFDDPAALYLFWSGTSGRVLIGAIRSGGRDWFGVISGNEFTPLSARWAQGSDEFGTW